MTLLLSVTLLIMVVSLLSLSVSCEEFYVTPTPPPNPACPPGEPCHTLSYYATNASFLFNSKDNVSLLFLDGVHVLTYPEQLNIFNTTSLILSGVNSSYDINSPQVLLHVAGFITISNVSVLEMLNLSIGDTGGTIIQIDNVHYLVNNQVVLRNSIVVVSVGDVLLDMSRYISVTFLFSFQQSGFESRIVEIGTCLIEDSWLGIDQSPDISEMPTFEVNIFNSSISGSTEITVLVNESRAQMSFTNCSISNGGLSMVVDNSSLDFELIDCELNPNFSESGAVRLLISGGRVNVTILNSTFYDSRFPGLHVTANGTYDLKISVQDSRFTKFDMFIQDLEKEKIRTISLLLKNVSFSDNFNNPSITVSGPANMTIEDCLFDSNDGLVSTFYVHSVNLVFVGTTTFSNNVGSTGGALYVSQSTIWLENGTSIFFINNTANSGGAIYIEESGSQNFFNELIGNTPLDYESKLPAECFYQLTFDIPPVGNQLPTSLYFENNSASIGGDNIYGASLKDDCTITPDKDTRSYEVVSQIFHFQNLSFESSPVSSEPKKVCLCENGVIPKCTNRTYFAKNINVSPGEKFSISVILVGYDFGAVTGGVFAASQDELSSFSLGVGQSLQQLTSRECTNLEYSIHTDLIDLEANFILSRDSVTASLQSLLLANSIDSGNWIEKEICNYQKDAVIGKLLSYYPVVIHITVKPCPTGFTLSPFTCQCETFLLDYVHSCTVINGIGLLYKNGTSWVNKINTLSILAHKNCPFDYCKRDNIGVDLHHPDVQCSFNRSGILCGGCSPNLSLALGSSQCLPCSNDGHIALVFVFIVAGIALVFFIKILDLTVARGTINGLIFYANVIWINQSIFFPGGDQQIDDNVVQFMHALRVFIAWLNLDFGIETCFFKGLDAYWKTWLQFVFPFYIWLIAGAIILACRFSTRATKTFGNNAVSVLATLFLLSYLKLLRTIISVLGFGIIQRYNPEGTMVVWLLDGNVPYLGLRHSFLFIATLLTFFLLWVPYTVGLLLIPFLRKLSDYRVLRWINKFKPLFDAYYGPLKDKHHYWIGITLIARTILAIASAATQAVDPISNILLVNIVCTLMIAIVLSAYKDVYILVLEVSFLFNLVIVSATHLKVSTGDIESQIVLTCTSVTVTLVVFIVIVSLHLYVEVRKYCQRLNGRNHRGYENLDQSIGDRQNLAKNSPTATVVDYREPLLESSI